MKLAKYQPTCDCGKPAQIAFKDTASDSSTWFFSECSNCEAALCPECYADSDCDDATGDVLCLACT